MKFLEKTLIFLCDIIFPKCCLICGKISSNIWCKTCKEKIYKQAIFKIENNNNKEIFFDKHIYIFNYKGEIRNLILTYKFNDKSYLYEIFSTIIIKNEKICRILKKYDIMIPVPIHKKRKNKRGYNQSELIASKIAQKLQIQYEDKIIKKEKNNLPQSMLNKEKRKQNVENVYKVKIQEKIKNKKIILFDDIFTTGSTVNVISKLLKENGAKEVLVLTIAKD